MAEQRRWPSPGRTALAFLRSRIAFTRRNAALPGMAFKLWTLPAAGGWVNWLLTVFSPLSLFLLPLGALCGWLFWSLIVTAPRRA
jgi:hypothetical protein